MSGTSTGGDGQLKSKRHPTINRRSATMDIKPYAALEEVAQRLAINRTLLPLPAMTCLSGGELGPHGGRYCHRLSG
jgi:hypothetical protein